MTKWMQLRVHHARQRLLGRLHAGWGFHRGSGASAELEGSDPRQQSARLFPRAEDRSVLAH